MLMLTRIFFFIILFLNCSQCSIYIFTTQSSAMPPMVHFPVLSFWTIWVNLRVTHCAYSTYFVFVCMGWRKGTGETGATETVGKVKEGKGEALVLSALRLPSAISSVHLGHWKHTHIHRHTHTLTSHCGSGKATATDTLLSGHVTGTNTHSHIHMWQNSIWGEKVNREVVYNLYKRR